MSEDYPVPVLAKPGRRMKTVTEALRKCVEDTHCDGCYLQRYKYCRSLLMKDVLWYLSQTLEKSEKKK